MKDFTEKEYKAEEKIIDKMSIKPKPNFYNYYNDYDAIDECFLITQRYLDMHDEFKEMEYLYLAAVERDWEYLLFRFKRMDMIFKDAIEILNKRIEEEEKKNV